MFFRGENGRVQTSLFEDGRTRTIHPAYRVLASNSNAVKILSTLTRHVVEVLVLQARLGPMFFVHEAHPLAHPQGHISFITSSIKESRLSCLSVNFKKEPISN